MARAQVTYSRQVTGSRQVTYSQQDSAKPPQPALCGGFGGTGVAGHIR